MGLLARAIGVLPQRWIKGAARLQWKHPLLKRAFDQLARRVRQGDQEIQRGVGRGLRINPGNSNAGYVLGTSEPELQEAYAAFLRPGMVVYDVGANIGFQALLAARLVAPGGSVHCFEPVPGNVEQIRRNAGLNGFAHLTVHPLALSDQDGEATFFLSANSNWGALASVGKPNKVSGEQVVPVRRLDALKDLPPPSAIKIDVEGAEIQVLAGAVETLRAARPVLFIDLHGTNAAVADRLEGLGYALHLLGGEAGVAVRQAPWDAQLLAVPAERPDLIAIAESLSRRGRAPRAAPPAPARG